MMGKRAGLVIAAVAAGGVLLTGCGGHTTGQGKTRQAAVSAPHRATKPAGSAAGGRHSPTTLGFGTSPLNTAAVPAQFVSAVQSAANTCPLVTAPLLAAQLEQESGWDPDAQSPIGAQGLAQFKPEIWAQFGGDADGDGVNSPFDPDDAIPAQARLMCDLFSRLQTTQLSGNLFVFALWAYNAGLQATIDANGSAPTAEAANYSDRIENELLPKYTLS